MFGQFSGGGHTTSYYLPLVIGVLIIVMRNRRPRKLKVERLWLFPVIYLVMLVAGLSAAPPPVTFAAVGVLLASAVVGGLIGWQRGRFTRIDLDPQTHEMTAQASVLGIALILVVMLARLGLRGLLTQNVSGLGVPTAVLGDGLLVLAVSMLTVQRLEIWVRATRMLTEARTGGAGAPPLVQ
jgi:hypothetical protein